ncbi:MAG: NAD(P)/FAD-dependent oxidoreductase [Zoogloea sp.]|nr:NAD(P)/FAD-dependent oxidoreductase [Zoogloea sp.]
MSEEVDCVVIGAGVVGLACARALALRGREVLILEAEPAFGSGISSRSSEVIHAGLYYPPGSLRARLCSAGRRALYAYCAGRGIPHRRCGKLVVATDAAQLAALEGIAMRAAANGADDLQRLSAAEAQAMEPALHCVAALHSPSTGIIDSHALMLALLGDAEAGGATLVCRAPVTGGRLADGRIELEIGGAEPMRLSARTVVNAAGLAAPRVAAGLQGFPPARVPTARYAKGNYFSLRGKTPFSRLIYPVPEAAGLGVHLTLDLGGQARFGPDVEWIASPDYQVDARRAAAFSAAIRRYWPGLPEDALAPAYAGVRPKIHGPDEVQADFSVLGPAEHGIAGLVQLFGIESPGLTSCLALAELVAEQLEGA